MNKLIIILSLMTIPLIGFSDTLDYWHIYYNNWTIAEFNATSQDLKVEINRARIKSEDIISVIHRDDTPCSDCKFTLFVRNEKKRKLRITQTGELWGKLSFDLNDLIEFGDKNKSKRYDFYYWEQDENGNRTHMKLVLQLKIID